MPVRTKRSILTVCGALLFIAACSKGGTNVGPAPLVEKSTAISTGDSICKQLIAGVNADIADFKSKHANPSDNEARDFLVQTLLARIDNGVGSLHRIGEPTKDRVPFDDAILALDKDLTALKQAVGTDPLKVLNNKITLFDTSAKLFTDYGFKECGKN